MTSAYPSSTDLVKPTNGGQDMRQLTPLEWRTIRYIHRTFGHRLFVLEQFMQEAPLEASPAEYHAGLLSLCRKQLVSIYRKTWGERVFQIPITTYIEQFSTWVPQLSEISDHMPYNGNINLMDWCHSMHRRLLWLALEIEREAPRMTQRGKLHKRDQERLYAKIGSEYTGRLSEGKLSGHAPSQSDEIVLSEVLDLALRLGLVRRDQESIMIDGQRFAEWLVLDAERREHELFLIWYRVHCPEHPALHWMTGAVRSLAEEQWMSMETLLQIMTHHGVEGCIQDIEAWVVRLHQAGWIEHAQDEQGRRYVRNKSTLPEEQRTLVVQHDMEVILYPQTPFFVIRKLQQFAIRISTGGVDRYRITANSVQQAVDRGWDCETIEHTLCEHAIDDVPEQVIDLIREWETGRAVIRLVPGVILYADTEQAISAIRWNAERLGLQPLNDHYWLAPNVDDQSIMRHLRSLGCQVSQIGGERDISRIDEQVGEGSVESSRAVELPEEGRISSEKGWWSDVVEQALQPQTPGLFQPKDAATLYHADEVEIDTEEMYPDYQEVPTMWHQHYRGYHPYTAKQLLEQAIRWQTSVRLLASEDEHDFIPRKVEEAEGTWFVAGYSASQPMQWRLDEIEKLQLLMPNPDI